MRNVLKADTEYHIRRIYRWFSKTFHVNLIDAFDIPLEEVLLHFYEEKFENLDDSEREDEIAMLSETEDQRRAREENEDTEKATEDELMEMARKTNESNINKLKEKNQKIADLAKPKGLPQQIQKLTRALKDVSDNIKQEMATDPEDLPPEIDLKFEDEESFQRLLEMDSNINSNKE